MIPGEEPASRPGAAGATTGLTLLAGSLWSTAGYLVPVAYTLVGSIIAARVLGPDGMGKQSFIAWTALSLALLLGDGLSTGVVRFVGERIGAGKPDEARALFGWALRWEVLAGIVGFAVCALLGVLRGELQSAWLLAGVACAAITIHNVPAGVLIGSQRYRQSTVPGLITGGLGITATVVVLQAGGGITGMFAVEALATVANLVWTFVLARRTAHELSATAHLPLALRKAVARFSLVATATVLFSLVVWQRSEFFFLDRYRAASEIAAYSVAFAAVAAAQRVPDGLTQVVMPAMATLFGAREGQRIRSGFWRAFRLVTVVSLPLAAGMIAVGPRTLSFVYGAAYERAGPVLVVLMITFPLVPIRHLGASLLLGVGLQGRTVAADAAASFANVVAAVILVPRHGAVGAAWASAVAQAVSCAAILALAAPHVRPADFRSGRLLRSGIAAVAAGLGGWLGVQVVAGGLGILAGVAFGAAAYLLVAVPLRALDADDAAWLSNNAGDRLGGLVARACRPFLTNAT